MDISEKIKTLRNQRGLTFEAVGRVVGVGKSTVRKWENGDIKNMRRDKIALLAQALGVTPGYLMGWEDEEATRDTAQVENGISGMNPEKARGWKILSKGFDKMPEEDLNRIIKMLSAAYPEFFNEGDDENES